MVILWQVNQKMILTLTASIMYLSLLQKTNESESISIGESKVADASPATSTDSEDTVSQASFAIWLEIV